MNGQPSPYSESDKTQQASIHLEINANGCGKILVNGHDLSSAVQQIVFNAKAGEGLHAWIYLPSCQVTGDLEAVLGAYITKDERDVSTMSDDYRRPGGYAGAEQE